MKICFIQKRFNARSMELIETINQILADYYESGFDLSLRQLYYQLVARNVVPNTERSYGNIGSLVSDARKAGLVDWHMIRDRGRVVIRNPHWKDPSEILDAVAQQFRVDLWENQSKYLVVMVEKQALEGVLIPTCQELDVPFVANKGYASDSMFFEMGATMSVQRRKHGRQPTVIYLGDHDPSGIDMTRDVRERLELYSNGDVNVRRVALNMDQVRELNPPENPAKMTDSRFRSYQEQFGDSSWELDAIEPNALAEIVRRAVMREIDGLEWDKAAAKQKEMRKELQGMADNYRVKRKGTK